MWIFGFSVIIVFKVVGFFYEYKIFVLLKGNFYVYFWLLRFLFGKISWKKGKVIVIRGRWILYDDKLVGFGWGLVF